MGKMKNIRIGERLLEYGYITASQLKEAMESQRMENTEKRFGEVLVDLGYISERQLLEALSKILELEILDLSTYQIQKTAVEKIPKQIAVKYTILAVDMDQGTLTVATRDPLNLYAVEDIRLVTDMRIRLVLAGFSSIRSAIDINYSELDVLKAATRAEANVVRPNSLLEDLMIGAGDDAAPVIRLLNSLLLRGYNNNVSDIHIEPGETDTLIRMRRDGMLLPYMKLPLGVHQSLVARTKIMAQMDIAEKRKPQDGHFCTLLEGNEMNIRVSFVPTEHGEKGVLRFLTTNVPIDQGSTFGMTVLNYEKMVRLLKHPHGILYFTGPTGSGKTTTLYSILEYFSGHPVNIATIEDPVERHIPRVNQMQVNELAGVSFESGLRALLRQDPDIIMIGETRDSKTAQISARAAMTGHLVVSTLHTNDALSSITRLRDMGLEPYMVAESLVGVVAQRLVRKICPHCAKTYEAGNEEISSLGIKYRKDQPVFLKKGAGCHLCDGTGYRGRRAVHEILEIDEGICRLIAESGSPYEIREYIKMNQNFHTLKAEAAELVMAGITTMEELEKIGGAYGSFME